MSSPIHEEQIPPNEISVDNQEREVPSAMKKKDWRRTVGMFDNDPIMKEISEEGQRIREESRQQDS
jgi:hypothetical protein